MVSFYASFVLKKTSVIGANSVHMLSSACSAERRVLLAGGWFVVREKYCWLVADKPSEQASPTSVASFAEVQFDFHLNQLGRIFVPLCPIKYVMSAAELEHIYHIVQRPIRCESVLLSCMHQPIQPKV
jgi:hypothetical protein